MEIKVTNFKNEDAGVIDLPEKIFGVKWNSQLVHQALLAQLANAREPWAHVKDRGEVRGGGKKPWKQKGTGRARHGSTRSPLWVGGGVTHGPSNERKYSQKINKKMKQLAVFSVLSKKLKDNEIKVIDNFESAPSKTKDWAKNIKNFTDTKKKSAFIFQKDNRLFARAVSNIKNIDTLAPNSLNVKDLLKNKFLIFEKAAIKEIK